MRHGARHNDFERFYYEKVALGESCGCAEQIIGTRDLDARAENSSGSGGDDEGDGKAHTVARPSWLARLFGRKRRDLKRSI